MAISGTSQQNVFFDRERPSTLGPCDFRVLIVYADTDGQPTTLRNQILAESHVTLVDLFDAASSTPTLGQLQNYNIVVPFSNSPFSDGVTLGDRLADYVDGGGIVVQCGFSHYGPAQPYGVNGRWVSGNYNPYNYSTNLVSIPFALGSFNTGHPLMAGVTTPQQQLPERSDARWGSDAGGGGQQRQLAGGVPSGERRAYYGRRYSLCRSRCDANRALGTSDSQCQ